MRTIIAIVVGFTLCAGARAQDPQLVAALHKLDVKVFKADSADAKLRGDSLRQLRDEVNKRDVAAWRAIKTKADWERFRDERIARLKASLGKFPEAPKSVKVITTKKLQGEGFTVENIIYESRPGLFVTANLYVPPDTSKPMPGFIIVHSHHNPKTQSELQDMGAIWSRQGCLVLIPDMLGHGERRQHPFVDAKSYPEKFATSRQDYHFRYNVNLQLSLVGESLMGWMVWDLMRGLDVLYQRPNLDKSKVMVFGSVAGGGDPCAVFAALDQRITAAAPFNFGGPQPETKFPLPDDAELHFNYMGGGSWESTRNLRLSGRDGFLPWLIVGSIAPRGLVYGHEFAWDDTRDPVWSRFNKIWGDFYGAIDKLASAKGRGSVKGTPPESTHCNNIGAEHRKPIYPTLEKWFGLPIPEENKKRFDASELQCWNDEARAKLKPKMVHEIIRESMMPADRKGADPIDLWVNLLGNPARYLGMKLESRTAKNALPGVNMTTTVLRTDAPRRLSVPVVILSPDQVKNPPVVVAIAQGGKAGFFKYRAETIAELLKNKVAVCLPDLRGTGETDSGDGRGRQSGATSYSATLLMHGQTVPGIQLEELALLAGNLRDLGFGNIALWGDSFAQPNDAKTTFAVPYDNNVKLPKQSEPMGTTLALLAGLGSSPDVKAIYARGGLVSFQSMLDSPFCYFPHDAVIPGVLTRMDTSELVAAMPKRAVRLEGMVDGLNRRVDQATLDKTYGKTALTRAEPAPSAEVAAWLVAQLKK
jgi:dienelactone hydrolase